VITMLSSLQSVILAFDNIVNKSGIDDGIFAAVLKIIGIGYLTEYSASIATDAGCPSIAQKLQFGGKLVIFMMSISIVTALIDVISALVKL
ncbi:MAG: SpoIIIAC/SpoIIIAD family protein, partial [Bacteroidales bacterium]